MVEHDGHVGELLKKLDDLGIANNTIVIYTTDNGAETFSWPDGGTTPFRGEKNTNWEGGYRVPAMVRWPGVRCRRAPRSTTSSRQRTGRRRWSPRRASRTSRTSCCRATTPRARTSRFTSTATTSAIFWPARARTSAANSSTGPTTATLPAFATTSGRRVFMEQKAHGFDVWAQPMIPLRLPSLFNLRSDPFERAQHEAGDYVRWFVEHAFVLVPAQAIVGQHLMSFQQFPPRQRPGSLLGRAGDGEAAEIRRPATSSALQRRERNASMKPPRSFRSLSAAASCSRPWR